MQISCGPQNSKRRRSGLAKGICPPAPAPAQHVHDCLVGEQQAGPSPHPPTSQLSASPSNIKVIFREGLRRTIWCAPLGIHKVLRPNGYWTNWCRILSVQGLSGMNCDISLLVVGRHAVCGKHTLTYFLKKTHGLFATRMNGFPKV